MQNNNDDTTTLHQLIIHTLISIYISNPHSMILQQQLIVQCHNSITLTQKGARIPTQLLLSRQINIKTSLHSSSKTQNYQKKDPRREISGMRKNNRDRADLEETVGLMTVCEVGRKSNKSKIAILNGGKSDALENGQVFGLERKVSF